MLNTDDEKTERSRFKSLVYISLKIPCIICKVSKIGAKNITRIVEKAANLQFSRRISKSIFCVDYKYWRLKVSFHRSRGLRNYSFPIFSNIKVFIKLSRWIHNDRMTKKTSLPFLESRRLGIYALLSVYIGSGKTTGKRKLKHSLKTRCMRELWEREAKAKRRWQSAAT